MTKEEIALQLTLKLADKGFIDYGKPGEAPTKTAEAYNTIYKTLKIDKE